MVRQRDNDVETNSLDLAARAAWLSFVGGMTQDQIANELAISRQRAQRLVARAAAEGLIRVRIDHKIADCLELERAMRTRYGIKSVWVSPGLDAKADPLIGLAPYAAPIIEGLFSGEEEKCFALGTGRTLRMVVQNMQPIDGSRHKLVSLIGNVAPDSSATLYEVILRLAEKTSAKYYPMAAPVLAQTAQERELLHSLPHVRVARKIAENSDIALVGIGQMSETAPLFVDGFITREEHAELCSAGAVGELCGRIFDQDGVFLDHSYNRRVVGTQVPVDGMPVYCIGAGDSKVPALHAALRAHLFAGLITDEHTARALLKL